MAATPPPNEAWLERLALHRPELRAWALYDWANSAVWTTVIAAVFPAYFARVAARDLAPATATSSFAVATTIGLASLALAAPMLGTVADRRAWRKRMLAVCLGVGAVAVGALALVGPGDWLLALALFVAVEIGISGSLVFYDALLPHIAHGRELDRLSTTGFALGYAGGGILLALNLAWIRWPERFGLPPGTLPTRLAFVSVAVWWVVFSVPLFLRVTEPVARESEPLRLRAVLAELRGQKQALLMLLAFLAYSEGIGTIYRMAVIYGTEIGIGEDALLVSVLAVQFVGVPCALLFGRLAARVGAKRAIQVGLAGYAVAAVFASAMRTATHFFALAMLVALVQGGTQALSRSLFASLVPRDRSARSFALFAVSERFAGLCGPAVFAGMIAITGSSRYAVASLLGFIIAGAILLARVDVDAGQRAARDAEGRTP